MPNYDELAALYGHEAINQAGYSRPTKQAPTLPSRDELDDADMLIVEDANTVSRLRAEVEGRDHRSTVYMPAYVLREKEIEQLPEVTMPRSIEALEQLAQMHEAQEIRRNERKALRALRRAAREASYTPKAPKHEKANEASMIAMYEPA